MTRKERFEAQMQASHEKALDEFIGLIAEMQERLAELKGFVDDHMGYDPDSINWGHVGDAGYILGELNEMTDWAFGRGEYAPE